MMKYPLWLSYPRFRPPAAWVASVVSVFGQEQTRLDSRKNANSSDAALAIVRGGLEGLGFEVEGGAHVGNLYRPVHFGECGSVERKYQIDSYHRDWRVGLEVEAGRAIGGNAVYRDIVQTSLLVDVDYFVLAVPQSYRRKSSGREIDEEPYKAAKTIFDSIFSTERLRLPFQGIVLIGY